MSSGAYRPGWRLHAIGLYAAAMTSWRTGREWPRVLIADDFTRPKDNHASAQTDTPLLPSPIDGAEARLAYVASPELANDSTWEARRMLGGRA